MNEAELEAYVERNREALDAALDQGYRALAAGDAVTIRSLADLRSALSRFRERPDDDAM